MNKETEEAFDKYSLNLSILKNNFELKKDHVEKCLELCEKAQSTLQELWAYMKNNEVLIDMEES